MDKQEIPNLQTICYLKPSIPAVAYSVAYLAYISCSLLANPSHTDASWEGLYIYIYIYIYIYVYAYMYNIYKIEDFDTENYT